MLKVEGSLQNAAVARFQFRNIKRNSYLAWCNHRYIIPKICRAMALSEQSDLSNSFCCDPESITNKVFKNLFSYLILSTILLLHSSFSKNDSQLLRVAPRDFLFRIFPEIEFHLLQFGTYITIHTTVVFLAYIWFLQV